MSVSKTHKHDFPLLKITIVLVTSGVYWSMLETGLGLISANLVACYGLIVSRTRDHFPKRTGGMFKLPSGTLPPDREGGIRQSDEAKIWNGPSVMVASSAKCANTGSLMGADPVELQDIRVTQTMERTEGRI